MPFAIAGPVLGAVAGSVVSSALSPGTSGGGGSSGNYYIPSGLGTADQTWQGLLSNINNTYGSNNLASYGSNALFGGINPNTQYAPGYQNAANAAGQGYYGASRDLTSLGALDLNTQQQLLGAGQNVYNLGLDPQSALYDRTRQQITDQSAATNSMYGLGSSAAGAGLTNQALNNFNIDWQNQQLQRAIQGLGAYSGAATTGGQYGQAAGNALTLAPQYTLLGGSTPYSAAANIGNGLGSFLQSNVYGPAEGIQGQIIPYLNYGAGAQAVPFQSQAQGAGAAGSLVSQGIQGLANNPTAQNAFSNFFSPASGSFGGGDFSGAFNSSPYYSGGGNSYGFTMG